MTAFRDALQPVLPDDSAQAALAGRVWRPDAAGPAVVAVRGGDLLDISASFPTMRDLCESDAPADRLRAATGERIGRLDDVLANTPPDGRDHGKPWLLAPIDLHAIKAAGVTFVASMIERVIEERARGDLNAAERFYFRAHQVYQECRFNPGLAEVCDSLANLLLRRGKAAYGLTFARQSLALKHALNDRFGTAISHGTAGRALVLLTPR